MIEHHDVIENEYVMDTYEAIVEIIAHLSCRKYSYDDKTCEHCPSRETNGCQEYQSKDILLADIKCMRV